MKVNSTKVPNVGPKNAKLMIIGESPGEEEENQKLPFVGPAGNILIECLLREGVSRDEVYLANLCNYRPWGNNFDNLLDDSDIPIPELSSGISEIENLIEEIQPNVILGLGNRPLHYLIDKWGISRYRGSILKYEGDKKDIKYIPSLHPSFIARQRKNYPFFAFDINRAVNESKHPYFNYPKREFIIEPTGHDLIAAFETLINSPRVGCDIETTIENPLNILCISFAPSPQLSYCFPWVYPFIHYAKEILESKDVAKIFHFGIFDTEVLYKNGIEVQNYSHDTMAAQQVLEAEHPRRLDFVTSIYTREPYYKEEGRGEIPQDTKVWSSKFNKNKLHIYNCKDSAVTIEVHEQQIIELELDQNKRKIYEFEMKLVKVAQAIGRNGLLIDLERREYFRRNLLLNWYERQQVVDAIATSYNKKLTHVNVNSNPQVCKFIYETLNLPEKYVTDKKTGKKKLKADEDSIVSNITYVKDYLTKVSREDTRNTWQLKLDALKIILEIKGIRKLLSAYIETRLSDDGRLRSTYKPFSTETGRWACQMYVDKTGNNAQTFPRESILCRDIVNTIEKVSVLNEEMLDDLNIFNKTSIDLSSGEAESEEVYAEL